jgi:hypothetical protein
MAAARPIIQLIIVSGKDPEDKAALRGGKIERARFRVGSALPRRICVALITR